MARKYIAQNLYQKEWGGDGAKVACVGHTHIDIAWLWSIRQTREKAQRSFATVLDLMEKYSLRPEEILVVDDLKPGYDMARAAGVHIAAAGWAHNVKGIRDFMEVNCDYFCESISALESVLFE